MLEAMLVVGKAKDKAVGQATWTIPGTYTWVCPDDVTEVSVLLVGGGAPGSAGWSSSGGMGGGVRWRNYIPVVPGTAYTVIVGSGGNADTITNSNSSISASALGGAESSSAFEIVAGNGSQGTHLIRDASNGGGYGASGKSQTQGMAFGGAVANINTDGGVLSGSYMTGINILTGAQVLVQNAGVGVTAGGGGSAKYSPMTIWRGGHGAARIIWGVGRVYPATKVTNQ